MVPRQKAYVRADNQYDILSVTGLMNFADSAITAWAAGACSRAK